MIERRVVRRYAAALFNAASGAGIVDKIESDLGLVSYTFEASPQLMDAMASPVIPDKAKHDIIRTVFGGKVDQMTIDYLDLLVTKSREDAILQTEEEFVFLANEVRGIGTADVTVAVELDAVQQKMLIAKLAEMTGKKITLNITVDPRIIGGVIVRIGDKVIDGSVKGQLGKLRSTLLG